MINCKCYKIVTERWERILNKFKRLGLALGIGITLVTMVPQMTYANLRLSEQEIYTASNWAQTDINKANEKGLIPQDIQGNYGDNINREEFSELAVTLYETLSRKKVSVQVDNPFKDTQNPNVIIANQLGLVDGRGDGIFSPYEKITKEEASMIIYKTLKVAKPRYDYSNSHESEFRDSNRISKWAKESVDYLYGIEVLNGNNDNFFNPEDKISREEGIVLVKRLYDKVIEADRSAKKQLRVSRGSVRQAESNELTQLKDVISKQLGKSYRYGAAGPNNFDCSGLTYYIYGQLGISIPRTSKTQINVGVAVSKDDLQYGDLVLFARDKKNINHVGIYVGNGNFVHSPQTGDVVRIQTLTSGYYANSYYAARRILK